MTDKKIIIMALVAIFLLGPYFYLMPYIWLRDETVAGFIQAICCFAFGCFTLRILKYLLWEDEEDIDKKLPKMFLTFSFTAFGTFILFFPEFKYLNEIKHETTEVTAHSPSAEQDTTKTWTLVEEEYDASGKITKRTYKY